MYLQDLPPIPFEEPPCANMPTIKLPIPEPRIRQSSEHLKPNSLYAKSVLIDDDKLIEGATALRAFVNLLATQEGHCTPPPQVTVRQS